MEREGALIYCHPPFHVKPWICWSIAPTAPTMYLTFPSLRPVPAVRTLKAVLPRSCLMEKIYMGKANSKMGFKNKNCLILLSSSTTIWRNWNKTLFLKNGSMMIDILKRKKSRKPAMDRPEAGWRLLFFVFGFGTFVVFCAWNQHLKVLFGFPFVYFIHKYFIT